MTMIQLLNGYTVHEEFFSIIKQQVEEGIREVNRNEIFTAKIVCGDGLWAVLSNWERRLAGRCVAYMVVKGILPFTFDNSKSGPTKWYRIKK